MLSLLLNYQWSFCLTFCLVVYYVLSKMGLSRFVPWFGSPVYPFRNGSDCVFVDDVPGICFTCNFCWCRFAPSNCPWPKEKDGLCFCLFLSVFNVKSTETYRSFFFFFLSLETLYPLFPLVGMLTEPNNGTSLNDPVPCLFPCTSPHVVIGTEPSVHWTRRRRGFPRHEPNY